MPDDTLIDLVTGIGANVATGLITRLRPFNYELSTTEDSLDRLIKNSTELADLATAGLQQLSDAHSDWSSTDLSARLQDFLTSTEVHDVFLSLMSAPHAVLEKPALPAAAEIKDQLRARFIASFLRCMELGKEWHPIGAELFNVIAVAAEEAIAIGVAAGMLPAKDVLDERRHAQLCAQIDLLPQRIKYAREVDIISPADIERFSEEYLPKVVVTFDKIVPPLIERKKEYKLDSLYVPARLHAGAGVAQQSDGQVNNVVRLESLAPHISRTVVLGDPGAGKSTLTKRLMVDVAGSRQRVNGRKRIPFHVTLREYAKWKQSAAAPTLVEYIRSQKHMQSELNAAMLIELLVRGDAFVIFDGLDELLDTSNRASIRDDIHNFACTYGETPILITSRVVGYQEAPLPSDMYDVYYILSFDDSGKGLSNDVRRYVSQWKQLEPAAGPGNDIDESSYVDEFMQESHSISDLRKNPLMLSLLVGLHSGKGSLPPSRPQVYEECADLMFRRWDAERKIRSKIRIASYIRYALHHIAEWMYDSPAYKEEGATRTELINRVAEYLVTRQFDNYDDARSPAAEFVDWCKGRAWVLTDVGATATNEPLYKFTHNTFLEYFAAKSICEAHETTGELVESMIGYVQAGERNAVMQLVAHIRGQDGPSRSNQIMSEVLDRYDQYAPSDLHHQCYTLAFALQLAKVLVIDIEPLRRLGRSIARCLVQSLSLSKEKRQGHTQLIYHEIYDLTDHVDDKLCQAISEQLDVSINREELTVLQAAAVARSIKVRYIPNQEVSLDGDENGALLGAVTLLVRAQVPVRNLMEEYGYGLFIRSPKYLFADNVSAMSAMNEMTFAISRDKEVSDALLQIAVQFRELVSWRDHETVAVPPAVAKRVSGSELARLGRDVEVFNDTKKKQLGVAVLWLTCFSSQDHDGTIPKVDDTIFSFVRARFLGEKSGLDTKAREVAEALELQSTEQEGLAAWLIGDKYICIGGNKDV